MTFKLDADQYEELRSLQKRPDLSRRRYRKVTVLIMLHKDFTVPMIEDVLAIDDNTIYRYVHGYYKVDLDTYLSDNYVPFSYPFKSQWVTIDRRLPEFDEPRNPSPYSH